MKHRAKEWPTKGKNACRRGEKEHTDDNQQQGPMTLGELAKKMVVEIQLSLGLKTFLGANKNCQGEVIV